MDGSRYTAPELCQKYITGDVHGHPSLPAGQCITTSRITSAEGRVVTTRSGSRYRLGPICPKHRKWLRDNGIPYDQHRPIRLRGEE